MAHAPANKRQPTAAPAMPDTSGLGPHAILDGLPDAFLAVDAEWRVVYVNPRMAELLAEQAPLGQDLRHSYPDLLGLRQHVRFEQPASTQDCVSYEYAWPESDTWFEVRTRPLAGGLLVHGRDITPERGAREQARRTDALLASLIEETTDAVFTKDLEGRYQLINSAGARALGRQPDGVLGRTDLELFSDEMGQAFTANDRAVFASEKTLSFENVEHTSSGKRVWLSTKSVLRDEAGRVYGLFGISRDITTRKWSEEETRRHSEFQEHLMGIISHDIRSPLGAIMNWSRVLATGGSPEDAARTSQRISTAAVRIERLTRLLLDFTRARLVGSVIIEPRTAELKELLDKVAHEFRIAYPQRDISVEHKGNTRGQWDPDRLAQVVSNLVENALKYGPAEQPVRLKAIGLRTKVVVEVHNEGRPIPESQLPHLFEPFRRGPQTARTLKMSYGLGLYIVREIVQAHGGTIEVSSSEDEGTRFTVTLPRRSMPPLPAPQQPRLL
ncbi:PAS domain-containing protein [Myxococcaceae bacterium JPH2]|nr:PAS domain-containing protein [Myxococcaceae bacterium JPH2]